MKEEGERKASKTSLFWNAGRVDERGRYWHEAAVQEKMVDGRM